MKQKIKEALKQGRENLGLSDEVFERVAASVETFVTDEADIDKYVKSDLVNNLLKFEQADADRKRSKRKSGDGDKSQNTGETKDKEVVKTQDVDPEKETLDLKKLLAEAVAEAVKPLKDEFLQFKTAQESKSAYSLAESTFKNNDYVKKYSDEAEDAWERATELFEALGKTWNAEELKEKAMGYFNKAVGKKGVDTSKPFEGDRGDNETPDFKNELEILKSEGIDL